MHPDQAFTTTHSLPLMLATEGRRDALARLDQGLGAREPFLLVTGEAGTGKSALVLEAIAGWGKRATVATIPSPALTRDELVEEIARRFGAEPPEGASKPQLLACLESAVAGAVAGGRVAVLVIEDAHDLAADLLEELRLVATAQAGGGRPLEILLMGLPGLEARLGEPALQPLRQRISVHCRLAPLSQKETRRYIHHRVQAAGGDGPASFPRATCAEIFSRTRGVPRDVNALAGGAMRRARAAGSAVVTEQHVRAAAKDLDTRTMPAAEAPAAPPKSESARVTPETVPSKLESAPAPPVAPAKPEIAPAKPVAPARAENAPAKPVVSASAVNAPARTERARAEAARPAPRAAEVSSGGPLIELPQFSKSDDPRVRDWVSKFIGEDGPPRLGSRVLWSAADEEHAIISPPRGAAGPSRGRTISAEEVPTEDEGLPAARSPRGPGRRPAPLRDLRSRRRSSLPQSVVAMTVAAALAAVILLPQTRRLFTARSASLDHAAPRTGAAIETAAAVPGRNARKQTTTSAPTDSAAAASKQRYTVEVATFYDLDAATAERDRVSSQTGLEAWVVVPSGADGGDYRVVVGIFRTRERADSAADAFVRQGKVSEARVSPLPPRRRRQ